ncbi:M14 family metallocarboxypeptidase [Psychromonas sp. MME2]|uniref:M14 family metallopeptidase n=1 Tax=unclassified Psychromonas TaxID=2614957 RepID=UPI00339CB145
MKSAKQEKKISSSQKWGQVEREAWLQQQQIQRSYQSDVVDKLKIMAAIADKQFVCEQYGTLSYDDLRYPLYIVKSAQWHGDKATILITGGVHGYETSGVLGALKFIETSLLTYTPHFNFIIAPCVSPWGYETINRWNPMALDPNRSFCQSSDCQESQALMDYLVAMESSITAHIDLHETTDTDNTVFRPALSARDAVQHSIWDIPDGFYLVGDSEKPVDAFQAAIIQGVKSITHIAAADKDGLIIGEPTTQYGVINYACKKLGLCAGFSDAPYCTTTEVYPDSATASPAICIDAQVAAITSALDYLIK